MKAGKRNYLFQRPPEREKCKIGLKSSHIPHARFKTSWMHGTIVLLSNDDSFGRSAQCRNPAPVRRTAILPIVPIKNVKLAKNSGHHFFHLIIVFYDLGLQMEYFPKN